MQGADRHTHSIKYQNLLEKHLAAAPLYPRAEFPIAFSMNDLTFLHPDTHQELSECFSHSCPPEWGSAAPASAHGGGRGYIVSSSQQPVGSDVHKSPVLGMSFGKV